MKGWPETMEEISYKEEEARKKEELKKRVAERKAELKENIESTPKRMYFYGCVSIGLLIAASILRNFPKLLGLGKFPFNFLIYLLVWFYGTIFILVLFSSISDYLVEKDETELKNIKKVGAV